MTINIPKGTIEPFNLAKEDRQRFRALLGQLTEAIWEKAEQQSQDLHCVCFPLREVLNLTPKVQDLARRRWR